MIVVPSSGRIRLISPESGLLLKAAFDGAPLEAVEGEIRAPNKGEHSLRVVSIDAAGNRSAERTVRVIIDHHGPRVELTIDPAPVAAEGSPKGPWLAPRSRAIAIAEDEGSGVQSLVLEESGGAKSNVSPHAEIELPVEGTVRLRAVATDGVGNASEEVSFEARIDSQGPSGEIRLEGPKVETADGTVVGAETGIEARFVDDGSGVATTRLFLDGVEAAGAAWNPVDLSAGRHRVRAEAVDRVGNRTILPERVILVDREGPDVLWQISSPGVTGSGGATFYRPPVTIEFQAEDKAAGVDRLEWSRDGAQWSATGSASGTVTVEGEELSLRAFDGVGNRKEISATWKVDFSPPRLLMRGPFGETPPPGAILRLPQGSSLEVWAEDDGSGIARQEVSLRRGHRRDAPHRYALETRGTYRLELSAEDFLGNEIREHWWVCVTRGGAEEAVDVR